MGRAVDEGDFVGIGVWQLGRLTADLAQLLFPIGPVHDTIALLVLAPGAEHAARPAGQGSHRGMVEIRPTLSDRELLPAQGIPVQNHSPPEHERLTPWIAKAT